MIPPIQVTVVMAGELYQAFQRVGRELGVCTEHAIEYLLVSMGAVFLDDPPTETERVAGDALLHVVRLAIDAGADPVEFARRMKNADGDTHGN